MTVVVHRDGRHEGNVNQCLNLDEIFGTCFISERAIRRTCVLRCIRFNIEPRQAGVQTFLERLMREFLRRVAYGSLIGAVLVQLLINSSFWKAGGAAISHAEAAASVAIESALGLAVAQQKQVRVVVVAIDDEVFRDRFAGVSPLNRATLSEIIAEVLNSTPTTTRVGIDLDVSPLPRKGTRDAGKDYQPDSLESLLTQNRQRLILARPDVSTDQQTQEWVRTLEDGGCGVEFADAGVMEAFGLLDMSHDRTGSLAARASKPRVAACLAQVDTGPNVGLAAKNITRTALSLSVLADPIAVSAKPGFGELLRSMSPSVVVIGGTWGQGDVFRTPFGERFGVQVHAARAAGHLEGRRTVAPWVQVLLAIFCAAVAVASSSMLSKRLALGYRPKVLAHVRRSGSASSDTALVSGTVEHIQSSSDLTPSATFARGTLRRFVVLLWVLGLMMGIFLLAAAVNTYAGLWIPMLIIFGFTIFSVTAAWATDITLPLQVEHPLIVARPTVSNHKLLTVFGVDVTSAPETVLEAVKRVVVLEFLIPLYNALAEVGSSSRQLLVRDDSAPTSSSPTRAGTLGAFALAVLHLIGRTVAPLSAVLFLVTR